MEARYFSLFFLTIGVSFISFYGCNGAGGGVGESGSGGGSIVMAAPTPLPPFQAQKTEFIYLLKCDGDAEGTHKETPKPGEDIEFKGVNVTKGARCTVQMATDVSKVSSDEFDFDNSSISGIANGLTIVYEGSATTEGAPAGSQGLVLNVTLTPKYDQPDGVSRAVIIPFTVEEADKNLKLASFKLVCGGIANFGSCTKLDSKSSVKCEGVNTELRNDCTLNVSTDDPKVSLVSKIFSVPQGKANIDTTIGSVTLLNQSKATSGPVKVNATIQGKTSTGK